MLSIEYSKADKNERKNSLSDSGDDCSILKLRQVGNLDEEPAACNAPQRPYSQLNEHIARADPCVAGSAAAAEGQPAYYRHIFPPCECAGACAAARARLHYALALG